MTEIYLIRHCEAQGNVLRQLQGVTDADITELGKRQLEALSKRFENIELDSVYSSPLIRAYKTACAVADKKGIEVIKNQGLAEVDCGVLEAKPFAEIFAEGTELGDIWYNHPEDFAPENGETMRDAYERIWQTVLDLAKTNKGKTVAAASHGGVLRCLLCRLLYNDINKLSSVVWDDNTAVSLIRFDDEFNPTLVYYSDFSHLNDDLLSNHSRLSVILRGKNNDNNVG